MKIEIGKYYKAKFSNALTKKDEIVEVEKINPGIAGLEVKLKGYKKSIIALGFVDMFERIK